MDLSKYDHCAVCILLEVAIVIQHIPEYISVTCDHIVDVRIQYYVQLIESKFPEFTFLIQ